MTSQSSDRPARTPDNTPLTESQAQRLSGLTKIDAADLVGLSIAEISAKYRWQIDSNLLWFVQICGTVVKQDPATGQQYPVPFATVYAEDTTAPYSDCSR